MKKTGFGSIAFLLGIMIFSITAWAQTYSSVSLTVTKNGSKYTVSNYSALSGYKVSSSSKSNDILTIKVSAGSGNSWSSKMKQSNVSIFGDLTNGDIKEFNRDSSSQIVIKLDVSEDTSSSGTIETSDKSTVTVSGSTKTSGSSGKSSQSTVVDDVELNSETGRVYWDGNADEFDLIFYKDGKSVATYSTKKNYYDFHEYFTGAGIYSVAVRADNGSDKRGSYVLSNVPTLTAEEAAVIKSNILGKETVTETTDSSSLTTSSPTSDGNGQWIKDDIGWWYLNSDNSYTVNNWQKIGDKWYYFDTAGYMYKGWLPWQGAYYFMGENGMETSIWTPDGYYVGSDGKWLPALGRNIAG